MVHGHGLDVEVGAVLGLVPEDILGHQALGVELHPVQDDLLELLVPGAVDEVAAVEVLGLVVHDPGGELLPVLEHAKHHVLGGPVEEHLAGAGSLAAGAAAQDHPVELGLLAGPGGGGTGLDALAAAHAAAGVLLDLAGALVEGEHPGGAVLTGADTGAAADAPLGVIGHAGHADDAEVAQVGLVAVVGAAGNVDFDMVMAGEDDGLDLPGQLEGVAVAADAVVVAHAGGDVAGADGGVAGLGVPGLGLVGHGVHVDAAQLGVHLFDVLLQILVHRGDVLILDAGDVEGLAGAEVEVAVAPGVGDVLHIAEVLGVHHTAGHAHLEHELAGHLGLPEAVQAHLLDIDIMIHPSHAPSSVHQIPGHRVGEHGAVQAHVYLVDAAVAALAHGAGHLALEAHPHLFGVHAVVHQLQAGELHHGRGTHHHNGVVAVEGVEGDLLDKGGDQAGAPALLGVVVQGIDGGEFLLPGLQLAVEHDAVLILEAGDEVHGLGKAGVRRQHVEHGADGGQAGAAGDDHQVLAPELLHGPALAVGAAEEEGSCSTPFVSFISSMISSNLALFKPMTTSANI